MNRLQSMARVATLVSLVGLVFPFPSGIRAEEMAGRPGPLVDVVLDSENRLHGQLVDGSAAPLQGELVLMREGQPLKTLVAGPDGRFIVRLSQGGTYQLAAADRLTTVRVWTASAAPPHSQRQFVLVHGDVLRGQQGRIPHSSISPWVVAGVVAVAIGVPIVLANHRDDRPNGS